MMRDPGTVSRRMVLALGAAALLQGCAGHDTDGEHDTGGEKALYRSIGTSPSGSHPAPAVPTPTPSAGGWTVPTVHKPTSGHCPTVPGINQKPGSPQYYLPCHGTDIALTIDDGPNAEWTPQVLALLAKYRIHATFCMIGRQAAGNPGLVRAVAEHGHQIANHTWTHPLSLPHLPAGQIRDEINRTNDAIASASGHRPVLFRSPGGAWSPAVMQECHAAGVRPLDWSVDPKDWSKPGVQHIVTTILTRTHPGSIILEHDGGGNRAQTVQALTIALPRLIDAGYTFSHP